MAMKVRVLLSSVLLLSTMWLASCGHYTCGITFGSSTCSSGGSGISQGGSGTSATAAYRLRSGYFCRDSGWLNAGHHRRHAFSYVAGYTAPRSHRDKYGRWHGRRPGDYISMQVSEPGSDFRMVHFRSVAARRAVRAAHTPPRSHLNRCGAGGCSRIMIANPAGTLLFFSDSVQDTIYVYQIGTGGVLTAVSGSPFAVPFWPLNLTIDGLGKYLYATYAFFGTPCGTPNRSFCISGAPDRADSGGRQPIRFQWHRLNYALASCRETHPAPLLIGTTGPVHYRAAA